MTCKIYRFLYKVLPILRWQVFLMDIHLSRCPECKKEYAADPHLDKIGIKPGTIDPDIDLWQGVEDRLLTLQNTTAKNEGKKGLTRRFKWAWAVTVAALLLIALLIPLKVLRRSTGQNSPHEKNGQDKKIIINSVTVEKKPAETIYFQPGNKDRLIVWVKKM